jgi:hypothetical protein
METYHMKLKTITKAALALALLSATSAFAADGSSGCGPGWYIFKENTLVSSSLRNTTNGYSSPIVTTGMTFGTSNCAQHKLVMNDKRGLHFVTHNTNNLLAETSMGQGESLGALASAMGCGWKSQARFNDAMKANFDGIFSITEPSPTEIYGQMINVVGSDPELAANCSLNAI